MQGQGTQQQKRYYISYFIKRKAQFLSERMLHFRVVSHVSVGGALLKGTVQLLREVNLTHAYCGTWFLLQKK